MIISWMENFGQGFTNYGPMDNYLWFILELTKALAII
jgi:hypothetical protein